MIKLKCAKFANAVKCGPTENLYVNSDKFDLTLINGMVVKLVDKSRGDETYTTLMNVCWWAQLPEEPAKEDDKPTKAKKAVI